MPVPTNLTPETAIVITTLPYSITLDAFEVPTDSLWFQFEQSAVAFTAMSFVTPVPIDTGTYVPMITVYTGTPGSLTPYLYQEATYPDALASPWPTALTSFFFEVSRAYGTGAFTEQVRFDLEGGPVAAAPAESVIVSDDSNGYPAVVISTTTGEILQTFPMPSGETADRLSTGESLWHDATNDDFVLYSPQFVQLARVAWSVLTARPAQCPISASPTQFYVGHPGNVSGPTENAQVTTVSSAGVLGGTTWDLGAPSIFALATNLAETILYYRATTGGGPAVKRWDLVNDLALSDLVAAVSGFTAPADLIVLDDDTILVAYRALVGSNVKRYDASGALLNTYTLTEPMNRMARSSDNLTTFWVWLFPDADYSTFQQIRISDGVVLQEATAPQSDDGVLRPPSTAPRQGPSNSCPFLTTPEALPALFPEDEAGPSSVTRTRDNLIRRRRRSPYLVDENRWTFHREIVVDLEPGVGTATGQGVDPQVMLRWSDDGGKTWSNEHWRTAGRQGEYTCRAIWRVLGRSRGRVYEITVSDPVAWNIAAAYIDAGPGVRG